MSDIAGHIRQRAESELCAPHPALFDEGELTVLHVIAVRLSHGMALTRSQAELLTRCAERVRRYQQQCTEGNP